MDQYDQVNVPGYNFINVPRKQKFIRKSGGLGAFMKEKLMTSVEITESRTDYLFWINICNPNSTSTDPIVIGVVYVPPAQSNFYSHENFDIFCNDVNDMCIQYDNVLLCGDFNAQTGNLPDYMSQDDFLSQYFDLDGDMTNYIDQKERIKQKGIQLTRNNLDCKKNNHGHQLINLCKNNNMIILNGRSGSNTSGNMTFRNTSVLDYIISTIDCFELIRNFQVKELDSLFSDGHCLLECELLVKNQLKATPQTTGKSGNKINWNESTKSTFNSNLPEDTIAALMYELNSTEMTNFNQATIDSVISKLNKTYIDCSKKTFKKHKFTKSTNTNHKPWYGYQCKLAKKNYNKARRDFHKNPSISNRTHLKDKSKVYKSTMNKHITNYNKRNEQTLRTMNTKNPKAYWKYLKTVQPNKKQTVKPQLETLYNHFKTVSNDPSHNLDESSNLNEQYTDNSNFTLNSPITAPEILKCIQLLKTNKSSGLDDILNEYIKYSQNKLMPLYLKIFNIILDTGIIPTEWSKGAIIPIYKLKGDPSDPENYRPITLLSCLSKLFTSILEKRLSIFLNENNALNQNQAGFRKKFSTLDHIFTLNSIIEIMKHSKKTLYCCFIDFSKAFDSVWRIGLWKKLIDLKINGKFLRLIKNMYDNIKSCISLDNEQSNFFSINCGVRQGENLSPILFSLFLNDIEEYLETKNNNGIQFQNLDINIIIKIIVLLYADDTILLTDNPKNLQKCLDDFVNYCKTWKLKVNIEKTKIMIFGPKKKNVKFHMENTELEQVASYKYLGTIFSKNGKFLNARKHVAQQAQKAMYFLYKCIYNLNLPLDLIFKLFDQTILPILLYSVEIWGYEDNKLLEKIHCNFIRKVLNLKQSTPLYMLYGESGRLPLDIIIKTRMISYWNKIITGNKDKLSYKVYKLMMNTPIFESKWINQIKNTLNEVGRTDIWLNQDQIVYKNVHKLVKSILTDQFQQKWFSNLNNSNKGKNYSVFKSKVDLEKYLLILKKKDHMPLVKLRTGNHHLPVETGRWNNIDISDRKCNLCNLNDVGDELHYVLKCPFFNQNRLIYIKQYFWKRPSTLKFSQLMTSTSPKQLLNLSKFVQSILKYFSDNHR